MGLIKEQPVRQSEKGKNGYYQAAILMEVAIAAVCAALDYNAISLIFSAFACISCVLAENKASHYREIAIILFIFSALPVTLTSVWLFLPLIPLFIAGSAEKKSDDNPKQ